ncbi:RNA-binding protein NOB1-like [Pyrus ussuriensis x Pyrus communis]|uniref:RNA-binding protein NOB1-like n=1 Tax=Pyrus ussuriensis x Pyrus communis TaxID=2448454 RepID=A0A5N5HYM4_9ROSA|nr:RNA-binding protein NOB1-like [Pyrus ussuriensis x Pyrus communis]
MDNATAPAPAADQNPNPNPAPISCRSSIVKKQLQPKPRNAYANAAAHVLVESCKSSKGIAMAVVDANAIIQGGESLSHCADKLVSIPEVMEEVRDPVSRHRLAFLPFEVQTVEPSPESLNKVCEGHRRFTNVDIKLTALTYTLEAQIHGTEHLRDCPPPVHMVNVKRLPEKDLPGWGNNVPNLEEWEALEHAEEEKSNTSSRILPLKDINLNVIDSDSHSVNGSAVEVKSDAHSENQEDVGGTERRHRRNFPKKKEISIEGKMVLAGIDASQGQLDDNADDWMPAVSRSTQRRFLRRKARPKSNESLSDEDAQDTEEEARGNDQSLPVESEEACNRNGIFEGGEITKIKNGDEGLSSILKQTRLEEDSLRALQEGKELNGVEANDFEAEATVDNDVNFSVEGDEVETINEGLEHLEISSETNESVDTSTLNDDHSEQSWVLKSLSESSVACITGDFAMQNVILQMGLRLVAPGGMRIRQLHRYRFDTLPLHIITNSIDWRCGNGGTLWKVAVTVGENGIVMAARRPLILRGTRFSLPLPQGGRDAISKNPILREDQLPQKFLHPKTKKKAHKVGDDLFATNDFIFCHHADKKAPLQPPIRKALAVFSGRRNPNDNHYSHSKHK